MIYRQFPLLPDEHLYSWLLRLYKLSGYRRFLSFQASLGSSSRFLKSQSVFDISLVNIALLATEEKEDVFRLLIQHSLLATWFISYPSLASTRQKDLADTFESQVHMNEQRMFSYDTSWQSCPVCRANDRRRFGSDYWHVTHQLPSITQCHLHGVRLELGIKPVVNLYQEQLPQDVNDWRKVQCHDSEAIDIWQQFVLQMQMRCINHPPYGALLRSRIEKHLGLVGRYKSKLRLQLGELTPEFEAAISKPVLQHLFRSHLTSDEGTKVNILYVLFAAHYKSKGIRNPIFWLAVAFWLRHDIGIS